MKKILFLCLIFSTTCMASVPSTFSLMAGPSAINSEVGYTVGINSPLSDRNHISMFAQFSELLPSPEGSTAYSMFTLGTMSRLIDFSSFAAYFKSSAFIVFESSNILGLNYAIGTEYAINDSRHFVMSSEVGYSLPFWSYLARGVGFNLGIKFYF